MRFFFDLSQFLTQNASIICPVFKDTIHCLHIKIIAAKKGGASSSNAHSAGLKSVTNPQSYVT